MMAFASQTWAREPSLFETRNFTYILKVYVNEECFLYGVLSGQPPVEGRLANNWLG